MQLSTLLQDVPGLTSLEVPSLEIRGVAADSRQVRSGWLFIAITGSSHDGHDFIDEAIANGAAAIVGERRPSHIAVPFLLVLDSRTALAFIAANWHGRPARDLVMIGVTGTDGKTTTANLIHQILEESGRAAGLMTTVNAIAGAQVLDTGLHVTTPEALDVQRYLRQMVDAGQTHCVLEATSHGLAQRRVAACEFDVGVVTNITHEHLDFHGTYEAYRQAKGLLFEYLTEHQPKESGVEPTAVLNRDDSSYDYLHQLTRATVVSYGLSTEADVQAVDLVLRPNGLSFTLHGLTDEPRTVSSSLIARHDVSNLMAALSATVAGLGLPLEAALTAVKRPRPVPGRMERIDLGQEFLAIVDFAHTPNALRRALETARTLTEGRVIAVFGSAGLRDRAKRRLMSEVSVELADLTILTAEDPRTESLDHILEEMAEGAQAKGALEGQDFVRVPDRGEALIYAVMAANKGDLVIACGKGHEQSMCFGTTEYPWDDRTALRAALGKRLGVGDQAMPFLPTRAR